VRHFLLIAALSLTAATATAEDEVQASYSVERGDTLSSISERFGPSVEDISAWNALPSDAIDVGQVLWLVDPATYNAEDPEPVVEESPPTEVEEPKEPEAKKEKAPRESSDGYKPAVDGFSARAMFGTGRVQERELGSSESADVAIGVQYGLSNGLAFRLSFSDALYDQTYRSVNPSMDGGGLYETTVLEQNQDFGLHASFDVAELVDSLASHVSARPAFGFRYVNLYNPQFDSWGLALHLGTELRVHVADRFRLEGRASWAPAVATSSETLSIMGLPRYFTDFGAGAGMDFGDTARWTVLLGWAAHGVVFEHTTRVRHVGELGLSVAL